MAHDSTSENRTAPKSKPRVPNRSDWWYVAGIAVGAGTG
jgi:hypothetical protein